MMCSICDHRFVSLGLRYVEVGGKVHSTAHPWVPINCPLTYMVYLLPFLSYLADSKGVSTHPSDSDTMTNTAQEAIASLGGNYECFFLYQQMFLQSTNQRAIMGKQLATGCKEWT